VLPLDPIEVARRKSLPRATQRDLADSQTRHGETATYEHIITEQKRVASASEPEDKLKWFRGNEPLGTPPAWPDS
jgi:hypothetical protein